MKKTITLAIMVLFLSVPALPQWQIKEVPVPGIDPATLHINRVATSPDGRLWIIAQNGNGPYIIFAQEQVGGALKQVGQYFASPGWKWVLTLDNSVHMDPFFPQNGNSSFVGIPTLAFRPVWDTLVQVGVNQNPQVVCSSYTVDKGKFPFDYSWGPFSVGGMMNFIGTTGVVTTKRTSSILSLDSGTCNLTTVATSSRELMQVWQLANGSFLTERLVSADPVNWTTSDIAVVGRNNSVALLVSAEAGSQPKVKATRCCDLAFDQTNQVGLIPYIGSDGGHAQYTKDGVVMQDITTPLLRGNTSMRIVASGLSGDWALVEGSSASAWVQDRLVLLNIRTKENWLLDKNSHDWGFPVVAIGLGALRPDGLVYFMVASNSGQFKLFSATLPGVTGVNTPVIDTPSPVSAGGTVTLTGKFLTGPNTTATVLVARQPVASSVVGNSLSFIAPTKAGTYTVQVSVYDPSGGGLTLLSNNVILTVNDLPPQPPAITKVVNGADFVGSPVPGSLATIFGTNLASTTVVATDVPLPTALANTQVTVNGFSAPLFFVSPTQINFQVPSLPTGSGNVQVKNGNLNSQLVNTSLVDMAPGIFQSNGFAIVFDSQTFAYNGMPMTPPVRPGQNITFYGTGLGRTFCGNIPTGVPSPEGCMLASTIFPFGVVIDGQDARVSWVGLAPGLIGVYQINAVVPGFFVGENPQTKTVGLSFKIGNQLGPSAAVITLTQ